MIILGIILYPFSLLYHFATSIRNYLFDIGYKKSFEFDRFVVSVGNLSVGGTGKTPMVEFIINFLKEDYNIATLSRGYGRKTKGFRLASTDDDASTIGDEPMQFYKKFKNVKVAVGEERAVAIPFILAEEPGTEIIILDDAYQHRYVKPNFNILLTPCSEPFYKDYVLPSGRLRESRKGANRADALIITKCDKALTDIEMNTIKKEVATYSPAPVYFTTTKYLDPQPVYRQCKWGDNVMLFSGIASSEHLSNYLANKYNLVKELKFGDHHNYSEKDIKEIIAVFESLGFSEKCLVTTEKDMVRLQQSDIMNHMEGIPVFYIPIEIEFLKDGSNFEDQLLKSIKTQSH